MNEQEQQIDPRTPHYRRTAQGKWVVCGPPEVVKAGAEVEVTTRAGKVKVEQILDTGASFVRDGDELELVYGYIAQRVR